MISVPMLRALFDLDDWRFARAKIGFSPESAATRKALLGNLLAELRPGSANLMTITDRGRLVVQGARAAGFKHR